MFSNSLKVSQMPPNSSSTNGTGKSAKQGVEPSYEQPRGDGLEFFSPQFLYTDGRQETASPNSHLGHIAYMPDSSQGHIFSPQAQDEANLVQNFAIQGAPSAFLPYTTSFGFPPLFYNTQLSDASRVFAPSPHLYPIMNTPFDSQAFQQGGRSDSQQQRMMFGRPDGTYQGDADLQALQLASQGQGGSQTAGASSAMPASSQVRGGVPIPGAPASSATPTPSSPTSSTSPKASGDASAPQLSQQPPNMPFPGMEGLAGMIGGMTPEETMMLTRQMLMGYGGGVGLDQNMLPRVLPMMPGVGIPGMPNLLAGGMPPMMGGGAGGGAGGPQHGMGGGASNSRKPKSWADVLNTPAPNGGKSGGGVGGNAGMSGKNHGAAGHGHPRPFGNDKGMYGAHMHDKGYRYGGGMDMHHHPHHHHHHHHHPHDKMAKGPGGGQKHRGSDVVPTDAALSKKQELVSALHLNPVDFDANPSFGRFFVIKSYSEDDIHKAIKYGIWASTDSGNRRLDAAWHESHHKGPIYLFYSVNTSGQFCGMAQMMSGLDYGKKLDVWAQDKWNGSFSVKWIFVKDIPNSQLRHIRLTNNDNKPVTNSRDTQEVLLDPGREMLNIFVSYNSKTSILDDFLYYDKRQEAMQSRKVGRKDRRMTGDGQQAAAPAGTQAAKAKAEAGSGDAEGTVAPVEGEAAVE